MADLEKLAGTIDGIEANVLKALAVGDSVKALDEQLQSKVTEFKAEVETLKADGQKLSEKNAELLKSMSTRLEDFERRYGRAKGPDGKTEPEMSTEKSFGGQVADWIQDPNVRDRARSGKGTSRLALAGNIRDHVAAVDILKSRNLPATDENVRKTILLTDATNYAPVNRLPNLLPMHGRRRVVSDLIPTRNLAIGSAWEYLEFMGLAPVTQITATSVASTTTVATLTSTAHGARVGDRILVAGATEAGYNGYWTVVTVPTADTLTYTIDAATADTTTGTILWSNLSTWGAAATVAENQLKPESNLPARTVTGVIELIAHIFRITKQALDDVVGLSADINTMGIRGLQELVEWKLLYGPGTSNTITGFLVAAGVQAHSQATTGAVGRFTMFRHGVTMLENVGAMPTGAVINPNDWETFETSVGLDDHWMMNGGSDGNEPRLWRVPLVSTRWIAPGTILMGDFQDGAYLVEREGPQVSFADQDGDDFKYNRVAMRFEQRLGLAITRPEFFTKLTLTS